MNFFCKNSTYSGHLLLIADAVFELPAKQEKLSVRLATPPSAPHQVGFETSLGSSLGPCSPSLPRRDSLLSFASVQGWLLLGGTGENTGRVHGGDVRQHVMGNEKSENENPWDLALNGAGSIIEKYHFPGFGQSRRALRATPRPG